MTIDDARKQLEIVADGICTMVRAGCTEYELLDRLVLDALTAGAAKGLPVSACLHALNAARHRRRPHASGPL